MTGQIKPPKTIDEINISTLEEFYFNDLLKEFKGSSFTNSLKKLESYINNNYASLKAWAPKNKLALPLQRLIAYQMFKNYKKTSGIYATPISSDVAFETKDAIINIDAKSVSKTGNYEDWKSLFLKPNQASFKHNNIGRAVQKNYSYPGMQCHFNLPTKDIISGKPILSFFVFALYKDDSKKMTWEFAKGEPNIRFLCVPNGELSSLFNYDLGVNGAKTWVWEKTKGTTKNKKIINKSINHKFSNLYFQIEVASKKGWYDPKSNQSWLDRREGKKPNIKTYFSSALGLDSVRVKYAELEKRFPAQTNKYWNGHEKWSI